MTEAQKKKIALINVYKELEQSKTDFKEIIKKLNPQ